MTQINYPSVTGAITVNYTFDSAGRPSLAVDSANGITYAQGTCANGISSNGVCYAPNGSLASESIGVTSSFGGIGVVDSYNNRFQPLELKASSTGGDAFDLSYNFVDPSSQGNAGHVYSITNNIDGTRSQTFTYDQLNRVTSALTTSTHATSPTHCWGEVYGLDPWANLESIAATTNPAYSGCAQESGFSKSADGNNHLAGFTYDASGNTSSDSVNTYTWNGESQLKVGGGVTYLYDGDGRRIAKVGSKLYWYGSDNDVFVETNGTGVTHQYVYFAGRRVALLPAGSTAQFYAEDFLGTSRVVTTNAGVVCYDADFYPYGGERTPYVDTCTQNNYKFEGEERDTETGNDDFAARYYSWRFGRWLSSDWSASPSPIPYANIMNPQTLNLYSMVSDDPESFADLDGHCEVGCLPMDDSHGINPFVASAYAGHLGSTTSPFDSMPDKDESEFDPNDGSNCGRCTLTNSATSSIARSLPRLLRGFGEVLDRALLGAIRFGGITITIIAELGDPTPAGSRYWDQRATDAWKNAALQSSRGANIRPDPNAQGPHAVPKRDPVTGRVTGWEEYDEEGMSVRRFRADGKAHGGVKPPLVIEPQRGKGRGSPPRRARPAEPNEIPK